MAQLPRPGNTEGNDDQEGFVPIAAGKYIAAITSSEMKETKAKTGHYLNLQVKIMEGDSKGKIIFDLLNLVNPNPVAVEIANKRLNSICKACRLRGVEDSEELHGIDMAITVGVEEATADWPAKNKILGYADLEEATKDNLPWE